MHFIELVNSGILLFRNSNTIISIMLNLLTVFQFGLQFYLWYQSSLAITRIGFEIFFRCLPDKLNQWYIEQCDELNRKLFIEFWESNYRNKIKYRFVIPPFGYHKKLRTCYFRNKIGFSILGFTCYFSTNLLWKSN